MKKLINRALRKAKKWLDPDPIMEERQRFPKFAYGKLNAALLEILDRTHAAVRPNYTWGVLQSAFLASALGLERISAIECGVAGGLGLISLERTAEEVEKTLGVGVDVYGFDTGTGLPKPMDYRDLPHSYTEGTYPMDQAALKSRLRTAKLALGPIEETLPAFIASRPAPVGFIAFDVDLYSSTVQSLKLLEADQNLLLPRIHCYFDDILGFSFAEFNGERLAIKEFNDSHELRRISPIHGLRYFVPKTMADSAWVDGMFIAHILDHDLYAKNDRFVSDKSENLS